MLKHYTPLSDDVDFRFSKEGQFIANVVRSGLCTPRYDYDLFSSDGTLSAHAQTRILSLGLFHPGLLELDVYDATNQYIGYICGEFWTSGNPKFGFTNAQEQQVGFALLNSDSDAANCYILAPSSEIVATLNGKLAGDLSLWDLDLVSPLEIDSRLLKIFKLL